MLSDNGEKSIVDNIQAKILDNKVGAIFSQISGFFATHLIGGLSFL